MTRAALSEALGGVFVGRAIGNSDPELAASRPNSVQSRGLVTLTKPERGGTVFQITPAGRKVVADSK